MWKIDYEMIEDWLDKQSDEHVAAIFAALEILEIEGPNLGRPLVDTLSGTTTKNLKELRPASPGKSEIRILFAFDTNRKAVMLLAGDKAVGKNGRSQWNSWYKTAIPNAERLFEEHQENLRRKRDGHERP